MVSIHVENYFDGNVLLNDEGMPLTTKGDTYAHGFGITSMKLIVESYGGTFTTTTHNDIFRLDALLPVA